MGVILYTMLCGRCGPRLRFRTHQLLLPPAELVPHVCALDCTGTRSMSGRSKGSHARATRRCLLAPSAGLVSPALSFSDWRMISNISISSQITITAAPASAQHCLHSPLISAAPSLAPPTWRNPSIYGRSIGRCGAAAHQTSFAIPHLTLTGIFDDACNGL